MAFASTTPILIVGDYNNMIRLVRNLRWRLGFRKANEANDAAKALAERRTKHYALVISDSAIGAS